MNLLQAATKALGGIVDNDFARNVARDMKSLRALWNWIYMALYVWICVWTVLYHPNAISTVVTVTGSVVSVIFTGYVMSKSYEKVRGGYYQLRQPTPPGDQNVDSD